jgi:hypothetical protein
MRNSRQFWQDVNLAICSLMLRERIHQIIVQGRNIRQPSSEITESIPTIPGRDQILLRYHELMKERLQSHSGHIHD